MKSMARMEVKEANSVCNMEKQNKQTTATIAKSKRTFQGISMSKETKPKLLAYSKQFNTIHPLENKLLFIIAITLRNLSMFTKSYVSLPCRAHQQSKKRKGNQGTAKGLGCS